MVRKLHGRATVFSSVFVVSSVGSLLRLWVRGTA
jgi:hypothetical protein